MSRLIVLLDSRQIETNNPRALKYLDVWLGALVAQYGYVGIFLVSLIGSLSIVVPVPYTILIFTFGRVLNPASWRSPVGSAQRLERSLGMP